MIVLLLLILPILAFFGFRLYILSKNCRLPRSAVELDKHTKQRKMNELLLLSSLLGKFIFFLSIYYFAYLIHWEMFDLLNELKSHG